MNDSLNINMNGQNVKIKKFNPKNISLNSKILFIGKSKSGKSWVMKDIMYNLRHKLAHGIAMCPTDTLNRFYPQFVPSIFTYENVDLVVIKKFLSYQIALKKINIDRIKHHKKLKPYHGYIIMDDCFSSVLDWKNSKEIKRILYEGRHYKLLYLLSMQYSLGIPPEYRSNFDYIILMSDNIEKNKKRLYEHYAGIFPNYDDFKIAFDEITDNYRCMVIINDPKLKHISDVIQWYKAKDLTKTKFLLGSKKTKKYQKEHYNKHYTNPKEK